MAVSRPSRYPLVALTPGGNYAEPVSGIILGGWSIGQIFKSEHSNWLFRQITDWNRSHDATRLGCVDVLSTTVQRVSASAPVFVAGAKPLFGKFNSGAVYYGNGERIDLTDAPTAYATQIEFSGAGTWYLLARPQPGGSGALAGSSCADILVSAVSAVAGWATIMTVTCSAVAVTAAVEHSGVIARLKFGIETDFSAGFRGTTGNVSGLLTGTQATFTGSAAGDTMTLTGILGSAALTIGNSSGGYGIAIYQGDSAPGIQLLHDGNGTGAVIDCSSGSGIGLDVIGGGTAAALNVTGAAGGAYAANIAGPDGTNCGGLFVQGRGTGWGSLILGGETAGAHGLVVAASNATGNAINASSAGTSSAPAILGAGSDAAAGVRATASAYHALTLRGDLTAPTYGTVLCEAQNAVPTDFTSGGLTYVGGTQNQWAVSSFADSGWRGVWSSRGGFCYGFNAGSPQTNNSSVTYTTLCTVTLNNGNVPKEAGRSVRITVHMRAATSSAVSNILDVQVRDTTAPGATIVTHAGPGVLAGAGWQLPGTTINFETTISFEVDYTIPVGGGGVARTFVLEFKKNGGAAITCQGSLTVQGLY